MLTSTQGSRCRVKRDIVEVRPAYAAQCIFFLARAVSEAVPDDEEGSDDITIWGGTGLGQIIYTQSEENIIGYRLNHRLSQRTDM